VRGIAVDGDGQRVLTHADIQVDVELDDQLVVRPVCPWMGVTWNELVRRRRCRVVAGSRPWGR
jgi:hypothetical protein